jgi:RimJ/RimL family protein N-acetyltransferase
MENAETGGGGRMNAQNFNGNHIRLAVLEPEQATEQMARWSLDSEYQQLLDSGPSMLYPPNQVKEWIEKHFDEIYLFSIRTLEDDRFIGTVDLSGIDWTAGNAWVGIGIGERDYWGKGYGTDAMNLILRFAFEALNLKRVSLTVFGYNERAYRSYKKVGFHDEGRMRQWLLRAGERYDLIFMGILRNEWEEAHEQRQENRIEIT